MRKIIQYLSLAILFAVSACGGGGGSGGGNPTQPNLVSTSGDSVTLALGAAGKYQLSGGVPPYRISNSDQSIVVGAVSGSTLTIGAIAAGTAKLTVFDNSGASIGVNVIVGSSTPLFSTAPSSLGLGIGDGASRTFRIGGGSAPYSLESSDTSVAVVSKIGVNQFAIKGLSIGSTSITILDAAGGVVTVAVTVGAPDLSTTAPDSLTIGLENASPRSFRILGGTAPYNVESSNAGIVAAIKVGVDQFEITGKAVGTANVNIRDANGTVVTVSVQVTAGSVELSTTSPASLTIGIGSTASRNFQILGGSGNYTVESGNNNVVTASRVGADRLTITGIAIGAATVKIRDNAGSEVAINVTVGAPELRVSPTEIKTFPGIVAAVKISGGQPPYFLAGGIPAAISATIKGDILEVSGNLASELELSVADSTGQLVKVKVTVEIGQATFGFSPSTLTVSENDNQPINLTIYGAAPGPVCLFTSNATVLRPVGDSCRLSRNVVVNTGSQGNRCVQGDQTVNITAVDAAGSVGTASITVLDNGTACEGGPVAVQVVVTPSTLTVDRASETQTATSNNAVIVGGSGTYVVTSSNPAAVTATAAGSILTVTGGTSSGGAPITVLITVRDIKNPALSDTVSVTAN